MGPTPEQTEAVKNHVKALNDSVQNAQAIDWSQIAQMVMQLLQLLLSSHVK